MWPLQYNTLYMNARGKKEKGDISDIFVLCRNGL